MTTARSDLFCRPTTPATVLILVKGPFPREWQPCHWSGALYGQTIQLPLAANTVMNGKKVKQGARAGHIACRGRCNTERRAHETEQVVQSTQR